MIDKAQIEAGKAAMKAALVEARTTGTIQFLGRYNPIDEIAWPADEDASEIDGLINIETLAQAFMRGAGIEPISDVAALQAEVAGLKEEIESIRQELTQMHALMRLVPQPGEMAEDVATQRADMRRRASFTPLAPRTPED